VHEADPLEPVARVVLVGMMGAGKTSVGRILADRLRWQFVDLDVEVERVAGRAIPRIFAEEGEPEFRRIETECTAALAERRGTVIASGGGWMATPGNLDLLGPGTLSVWLRVSADEAVRRLRAHPVERPMLASQDPAAAIRRLAEQRDPEYARADLEISTVGRSPDDIAGEIADLIRARATPSGGTETSP
jgi:shikimate kinase